ncbi:MAG: hypothetical protein KDD36_02300 [Flavobacteriales bacterium]|nr:hypothetical protein [Flavobacteriales bacterium]
MKIRVGIIFGGSSREREVSFAGGRTVYDNLNKALFEAVPVFVDSFNRWTLLEWPYIYKGSIRDFYPPAAEIPPSDHPFQIYAECLGADAEKRPLTASLGKPVTPAQLSEMIDIAFLCLHGAFGEDGRIQGLLEYEGIPYTGSGILPSAIAIDKVAQRKLMVSAGYASPSFITINRKEALQTGAYKAIFEKAKSIVGLPMVIKSSRQGSSIGVTILKEDDPDVFRKALEKSFFCHRLTIDQWNAADDKPGLVRALADFREHIGLPLLMASETVYHPEVLLEKLTVHFRESKQEVFLQSLDTEQDVIIEAFINGKEFSCIVVQDENGEPLALPPTEIKKKVDLFDYRSKYLPGLSRKITPIDLPITDINRIRKECESLFTSFMFDVYARIDGFITEAGDIFLNDPNTTSGMMPSSFFFHQAAEIGLNPSQFLTYIIRTSFVQRKKTFALTAGLETILDRLDQLLEKEKKAEDGKKRIAVILGGYSSERHISVESGRNVYEKLASSAKYFPIPIFLTGSDEHYELYQIPVNILLKDNADDIRDKAENFHMHEVTREIIGLAEPITKKFTHHAFHFEPRKISFEELGNEVDEVFIALHGRPGEDGAIQTRLEAVGLPYNGSDQHSSEITIDKFATNELLRENGFLVADHMLIHQENWSTKHDDLIKEIEKQFSYPLIAKPVDDGCSSAVCKIKNRKQLEAYARTFYRGNNEIDPDDAQILGIKPNTEFTAKKTFLLESLISKEGASHFLEITGGMLTHLEKDGTIRYEVFEASEALTEGDVLSLEEKFLAGEGQNITPARYARDDKERVRISTKVKDTFEQAARLLNIQGYARIDAFVRIYADGKVDVIFIEVNSLPGMTPATCIFHQSAINGYKPFEFIDRIMEFSESRTLDKSPHR